MVVLATYVLLGNTLERSRKFGIERRSVKIEIGFELKIGERRG
jgi:hypothetical protein